MFDLQFQQMWRPQEIEIEEEQQFGKHHFFLTIQNFIKEKSLAKKDEITLSLQF